MAARADQAAHQSSHDSIEAVTSAKSVSATPLVTKRGPQCPIAEVMRGSADMSHSSFDLKLSLRVSRACAAPARAHPGPRARNHCSVSRCDVGHLLLRQAREG